MYEAWLYGVSDVHVVRKTATETLTSSHLTSHQRNETFTKDLTSCFYWGCMCIYNKKRKEETQRAHDVVISTLIRRL